MVATLTFIYIALLAVLLVFDLRQRRIVNTVLLPALLLAVGAAYARGPQALLVALLGALAGLAFFSVLYWMGSRFYGSEALGFGDVKLAMLIGAMLGLKYVWPALLLAMLSAGVAGMALYLGGRVTLRSSLPYGAFMAGAGIVVLVWTGI